MRRRVLIDTSARDWHRALAITLWVLVVVGLTLWMAFLWPHGAGIRFQHAD